ncbi:RlmE family RNA methyltransferase [Flexistipes sinusarabici]|uniref:Ribosomal RNA large subunit methyltransferase E n=1 Tax=Flexistipes sinusarabici TaxID=2352 RepID=A0A5D0MPG4_FLESI|nr:RlmE family RNA methyltransferase [Flexistipes sinusarabici]TYB32559.1 MAG: RlmE family RNA methyltransferase [Flexistipes sinusarabici]
MYKRKDRFYQKAKQEGYKSRAAYKLKEINDKHNIISKNDYVLDAGAAPGGWSQILLETVGKGGMIVGVDLLDVEGISGNNFTFIKGDLFEDNTLEKILSISSSYDVVVSDAAPNTSGQKFADHAKSIELVGNIYAFSRKVLKNNGDFIAKLFDGEDTKKFVDELKKSFKKVSIYRPKSTRKNSFEIYLICRGYKDGK